MFRGSRDVVLGACFAAACSACGSVTTTPSFEPMAGSGGSTGSATTLASGSASTATSNAATTTTSSTGGLSGPIGGDRLVEVELPPNYDPATASPLLILLHGYSATGELQEFYLNLSKEAKLRGYLFAHPDGLVDSAGLEFWNATDACCDFYGKGGDDSSYLAMVIDQITEAYHVDPKRVFVTGHSNGGFMSHRLACDHSDKIAAIASLAGSTWEDQSKCTPSTPLSVLVVHGTLDPIILYGGGKLFGNAYPGAIETAEAWAALEGCAPLPDDAPSLDLVGLSSKETKVRRWQGCPSQRVVEHWRVEGSGHVPLFNGNYRQALFDFFDANARP